MGYVEGRHLTLSSDGFSARKVVEVMIFMLIGKVRCQLKLCICGSSLKGY